MTPRSPRPAEEPTDPSPARRRDDAPPAHFLAEDRLSIRLLQTACRLYCRIYHQTRVRLPQRLPASGPAILVCNHISGLDPLLVQSACQRPIVWMMAKEYYSIPGLHWVFHAVEAIPVDRGGRDMSATRSALRALSQGRVLGIFPEGRIETAPELLPFQSGVAMIAQKTGVPVYPAYLEGTNRGMEMVEAFATPNEVDLYFGRRLDLEAPQPGARAKDRASLGADTERIEQAVRLLRAKALLDRRERTTITRRDTIG